MKRSLIIGVMGGGQATDAHIRAAYRLGSLIARQGWVLLNGGRNAGIMEASAKGAWEQGGITVGILPDDNEARTSEYIQIPILTGMGNARNAINVLSSNIVVACAGGAGTLSEVALAVKSDKKVIALNSGLKTSFDAYIKKKLIYCVETPEAVIEKIKELQIIPG